MERISKEEIIRCLLFSYPQATPVSSYQSRVLRELRKMQNRGDVQELFLSSALSGMLQFIPTKQGLRTWGVIGDEA
jgi:hypothetical protein